MDIGVIGTGYVGLVVGAGFAHTGHDVVCADVDEEKIEALSRGEIPIHEPGLEDLVGKNLKDGRLRFTSDVAECVRESSILFIAVGTPSSSDGTADLRYVLEVARTIGRAMDGPRIVVTKSTVPVGTAHKVREVIQEETDHDVRVCSNPEFLKEGAAVDDFMKPDRVVLGVDDEETADTMRDLFAPFVRRDQEMLLMDVPSAEITKYAANAMLATRISFMNHIARLCEKAGADAERVRMGVGTDPRIGTSFLYPGIGYGGSCFPKDVKALIRTSHQLGVDPAILEAVDAVNEAQKEQLLNWTVERFGEDLSGVRAAIWGLAFKPNTDDLREAPSRLTVAGLRERGATVTAHDPAAMDGARTDLGEDDDLRYVDNNYEALEGADVLLIHTEWHLYRRPNFERMRAAMRTPVIFDGRNLYDLRRMARFGFEYRAIGRPRP